MPFMIAYDGTPFCPVCPHPAGWHRDKRVCLGARDIGVECECVATERQIVGWYWWIRWLASIGAAMTMREQLRELRGSLRDD